MYDSLKVCPPPGRAGLHPTRPPPPPATKEGVSRRGGEEEEEGATAATVILGRGLGSKDCRSDSWPEEGAGPQQIGDSYTCRPCRFESQDLNLFLDHVYSGHPEFRADPSFHCLPCGVSMPKFEGLALHNARAHPSLGATATGATATATSLQVRRRDRRIQVEQSLVTVGDGAASCRDTEISITKTPIMKMLRGKSEPKRIVVGHQGDEAGDPQATMPPPTAMPPHATHNGAAPKPTAPPLASAMQIVNGTGALPLLKPAISQVVTVVQNRAPHQTAPITVSSSSSSSSPSSSSSRNLPKVLIPLSSIPTYSAAMDSSSFLKTSFSKFPYPTKAELCYLTVVTKYPEEQIKIWFTAQRLKQGISWSPEEIEDSRRKMFNTIIQAPPASTTAPPPAQVRPAPTQQHSIAVLPPTIGQGGAIPQLLQGGLVGQGGVIVTPPPCVITNGLQVGSAPVTLAVTPRPQPRPQTQARPAAAVGADKGGVSVLVGGPAVAGGSNSSRVTVASGSTVASGNGATSNNTSILTSICSNSTSNGSPGNSSSSSNSTKTSNDSKAGESPAAAVAPPVLRVAPSSRTLPSSFLDPSFYKSKKSAEQLGELKQSFMRSEFPGQEEVERLTRLTGLTVREVRKWFSDRRYHNRNLKGPRAGTAAAGAPLDLTDSSSPSQAGSPRSPPATVGATTATRRAPAAQAVDFTAVRYRERDPQQVRALEASYAQDPLPSTEEVDRLRAQTKMTRREIDGWFSERRKRAGAKPKRGDDEEELEEEEEDDGGGGGGKSDSEDPLQGPSTHPRAKEDEAKVNPKVNPIKINLKMLKVTKQESESGAQPERDLQYDQLIAQTGLPRPEVVRWFGDSRYVYKNGQLKWLESYQLAAAAEDREEQREREEEAQRKGDTAPKDHGKAEEARGSGDEGRGQSGSGTSHSPENKGAGQDIGAGKEEEPELSRSGPASVGEEGAEGVEGVDDAAPAAMVQFAKPGPSRSPQDTSPGGL
ncbi:hypothetical protein AGOR_G00151740 [Albula goreensis]|uniref:Homeobox domain-containing protein n=1 Tax=Albula goreensis TaxID=1534307 RepID=A0A8T3D1L7_9TELE|nr:hypothetical protein AGOR_G00151740 [Albula goreensis]